MSQRPAWLQLWVCTCCPKAATAHWKAEIMSVALLARDLALDKSVDISEFVQLRRDIHQHPELAFEEHRTSELVAQSLSRWGYQVTRGLGETGVVGQLRKGNGTKKLGL